jgi:hypothetical protein
MMAPSKAVLAGRLDVGAAPDGASLDGAGPSEPAPENGAGGAVS